MDFYLSLVTRQLCQLSSSSGGLLNELNCGDEMKRRVTDPRANVVFREGVGESENPNKSLFPLPR